MTPPWVGTFGTQIQSRPQPPGKLLLPQLLHVGAPVLRPTFYTLPLFMAPPVTYQPGPPASLRLQTLGAQPPTQLHFWTYSLDQGALPIRQLHLYHPLPHTSSKGVPSLYRTQDLEVIWTWDPSQCTEPRCSNPMPSSLDPPAPFPQPGSIRIEVVSPSPPTKWLAWASLPPFSSHLDFTPPPLASKLRQGSSESSWGLLPLSSHLSANGGSLCLAKWGSQPSTPTSWGPCY